MYIWIYIVQVSLFKPISSRFLVRYTRAMTRPAGTRIDHYELIEHLADGSQAEVHRARNVVTGQVVVLDGGEAIR